MAIELPNPAKDAVRDTVAPPPDQELTIDDIAGSAYLSQQGAMAGDKWTNGQLERVYSKPEDATDFGYIIQPIDIYDSPYLQEQGAKVGDRYVDGKVIKSEYDSAWQQFKHGYKSTDGLLQMGIDIVNSYIPLAGDTEKYGEEFANASNERRRQLIEYYDQREIQKSFDPYELYQMQQNGTGAMGVVGEIAGALADPTSLLPAGATLKGATAIGSALGLGHSVAEDYSKGQEIDATKAAISTVGGGVFGAGAQKLGRVVSDKLANRRAKLIEEAEQPNASKLAKATKESTDAAKKVDEAVTQDSAVARVSDSGLDKYLGVLSTRVKNVSEPLFGKLRKFEFELHTKTHDRLAKTDAFVQQMLKLNKHSQRQIGLHLSNGQFKEAMGLMPDAMKTEFAKVQSVLKEMDSELKKSGHEYDSIPDYFPRKIEDYDKFLAAQGRERRSYFEKALDNYAERKGKAVVDLSDSEKSRVLNLAMRGYDSSGKINTAAMKERTIETLTPDQYQFYKDPVGTLQEYIRHATHDIEKRNFFGRSAKADELGLDTGESIGALLKDEIGNLPKRAQDEVRDLLGSRFKGGEQTLSKAGSILRDTGYAGTIANPMSALVQLGDLATSGALHGLKNTMYGLFGDRYVKLVDIGVEQVLSEELANPRWTGRQLNKLFKVSGFRAIDRLGKETTMNAALKKNFNLVKTAKGEAEFRKKWSKVYGDEIDSMVASLKAGNVDQNIKLHAFNELADIQPIALSEMPQKYLEMQDGRLLYMLKSFMIKQYDIARRNVVQEFKNGNKLQAVKNMTLLGGYLMAANTGVYAVRDWIQGRDVKPEDLPSRALWALGGVYGMDKYTGQRYFSNGQIKEGLVNMITPATPLIDAALSIGTDAYEHLSDLKSKPSWSVEAPNYAKYLKPVPVFGNLVYQWFLGGAEAWNEDMQRERKKANRPDWMQ
jgi:hypothetical protein